MYFTLDDYMTKQKNICRNIVYPHNEQKKIFPDADDYIALAIFLVYNNVIAEKKIFNN